MLRFFQGFAIVCAWWICVPTPAISQQAVARHVVILGFDGLSPAGLAAAKAPTFDRIRKQGSWTMHARGVMPTVSSPNWASMINGAGPEQHGVLSNEWMPGNSTIPPTASNADGVFPTIFGLLRAQRPKARIGIFHDWDGFARLVERGVADTVEHPKGPVETMTRAIAWMRKEKPDLLFVHLDHVDEAGHEHGHGSPQYVASVEEADRLTGLFLTGLEEAGMSKTTLLILTADHGGVGKKHGGNTMAELEIPWIASGPGFGPDSEIKTPVNTYDTAATAAWALGLRPPDSWIGRPVNALRSASTKKR